VSTATNRQLSKLPIERLRALNGDRNNLAHGHFDQNPYDGSYQLTLAAKTRDYPISRILSLAEELGQIVENLRTAEIIFEFEDLDEAKGKEP
jgi:hypothetical protein